MRVPSQTTVVKTVKSNSRSLRLCFAAHKTQVPGAQALTLAIVNLSLFLPLSPGACWIVEFNFLRKKGPRVVSKPANLRPISLVADLAFIADALCVKRTRAALQNYWGPSQSGSLFEALLNVVAVVILCQLRVGLGILTFFPFGDVEAAFDGASRDEMLAGLFDAGVTGRPWMQMDDIFANDECYN